MFPQYVARQRSCRMTDESFETQRPHFAAGGYVCPIGCGMIPVGKARVADPSSRWQVRHHGAGLSDNIYRRLRCRRASRPYSPLAWLPLWQPARRNKKNSLSSSLSPFRWNQAIPANTSKFGSGPGNRRLTPEPALSTLWLSRPLMGNARQGDAGEGAIC